MGNNAPTIDLLGLCPGLSLSFEAAVACKLSPIAVKYMASGHVSKALKGLSI